jgi:hypothetical protein
MIDKSIEQLVTQLRFSWSLNTSASPKTWSPGNPSIGQCAVSALIIQDILGGKIVRCIAVSDDTQVSHYFNELTNGQILDSTISQFSAETYFIDKKLSSREYLLSNNDTLKRYTLLKENFTKATAAYSDTEVEYDPSVYFLHLLLPLLK